MDDDPKAKDPLNDPLDDRQTFASNLQHREFDDGKVRHGRDLARENIQSPKGSINHLEGDTLWERLRPYLIIAALIAILLGVLNYAAPRAKLFEPVTSIPAVEKPEGDSLVSRPSASRSSMVINPAIAILEDNTMTMGGYERLKRLSALSARGVVSKDGEETPFSLYARRPNYYRLVYQISADDEYIIGFNGEQMWEEYKHGGASIQSGILKASDHEMLQLMADFDLPPQKYVLLAEYMVNRQSPVVEASLLSRDFIEGSMMEIVRFKEGERPTLLAYIGASNNLLYQTVLNYQGKELRVVYDDYRKQDGVYFPFKREQYEDGKLTATVEIDSILFNPGTLLGMFDPPAAE